MKLLNEIIDAAADTDQPVTSILRKCLILAFELKNEKLKAWVESELNGYDRRGEVPEYRKMYLQSKGNFSGPMGSWIGSRPLPLSVLKKEHQKILEPAILFEPIAAYESEKPEGNKVAVINWPSELIVMYQSDFIRGYALSQAWQELSSGAITGIVDTVRTRLLRFALEIREELGSVSDNPKELPAGKVDQAVTNYIFGGTNVIAGIVHDFTQIGSIEVKQGDLVGLANALRALGVAQSDVEAATLALVEDGKPPGRSLGARVMSWMQSVGSKLGGAGLKIGTGAAQQLITKWMLQYWGFE
jgi:hypothetical protein